MSRIEWTEKTWNPVTGCTRVSPGCDHCYMYAMYPRLKSMNAPGYQQGPDVITQVESQLEKPLSWKKPAVIFVCSMSDLFHREIRDEYRNRIFEVMERTAEEQGHIFQLLTKRPGQVMRWLRENPRQWHPRIWLGASVEAQRFASRLDLLAKTPARVRFVSTEPLLEQVNLSPWLSSGKVNWVIAGGESGPGCRPMRPEWAASLRDQCQRYGVPFFFKQWGGFPHKGGGEKALLDGRLWREMPDYEKEPAGTVAPVLD